MRLVAQRQQEALQQLHHLWHVANAAQDLVQRLAECEPNRLAATGAGGEYRALQLALRALESLSDPPRAE